MSKEVKRYNIDQCALYKCRRKRRLEQLLCIEPGGLKEIENVISYHAFDMDKKCTKKGQVAEKRRIRTCIQLYTYRKNIRKGRVVKKPEE